MKEPSSPTESFSFLSMKSESIFIFAKVISCANETSGGVQPAGGGESGGSVRLTGRGLALIPDPEARTACSHTRI